MGSQVQYPMATTHDTDHIPVPAEHSPRKETYLLDAQIMVAEVETEDAWVQGPSVAVER